MNEETFSKLKGPDKNMAQEIMPMQRNTFSYTHFIIYYFEQ